MRIALGPPAGPPEQIEVLPAGEGGEKSGSFDEAADAFLMWTKAAGKVLPGLVKRRNDERALFLSG